MIWGINNSNHEIVGTTLNYEIDVNNEPLKHYLARNLNPSINFYFLETQMNSKRVVVLVILSAKTVPTAYKDIRYIRIGSSKENLKKYLEREAYLFSTLTFNQLKTYYASKIYLYIIRISKKSSPFNITSIINSILMIASVSLIIKVLNIGMAKKLLIKIIMIFDSILVTNEVGGVALPLGVSFLS